MSFPTLDLFAGAGGLTEGLRHASPLFRPVRAIEMDEHAASTYDLNHGAGTARTCTVDEWLATEEPDQIDVDVIVGGPPCQGFSTLGKQDANDRRNTLWRDYAQTILRVRPKYFVVENVSAFLKNPQLSEFDQWTQKGGPLAEWTFRAEVLNSADYGSWQARRRAVLIGHHRDLPFPGWPDQQRWDPRKAEGRATWRTVREAFDASPGREAIPAATLTTWPGPSRGASGPHATRRLHVDRTYTQLSKDRFAAIKEGGNRFDLPVELQSPCWRRHATGSADVMGRLHWDRPSVTIRTEFFKPEKGRYLHPEEDRAITHWEAARLQGFGDDYQWYGTRASIARQIGNAVPVPLGRAIGDVLARALRSQGGSRLTA